MCHHSDTNSNIQPNCEAVTRLHTEHGSTQCQAPGAGNQRRPFTLSRFTHEERKSKCDDPISSSHVGTHEAELHGYQISGIRPEPILTKSAGKSCWSMLTVLLSSAGRRLCTVYPGRHGANSIIASMNCTWTQCTLHPGGQQTTVYKHATTCWAGLGWAGLGWVVQQLTPAGHY